MSRLTQVHFCEMRSLTMNEVVEVRMASWQTMVQNRNASGLSIKDWCPANKVSESQYYYRLRQLRNAALSVASQTSTLNVGEFTPIPLGAVQPQPFSEKCHLSFLAEPDPTNSRA